MTEPEPYRVFEAESILTPALLVYADYVDSNIDAALRILDGDPDRWRPHLKTTKMPWVWERLITRGVRHFKCATTLELDVACQAGAKDVLLAYPLVGANARRLLDLSRRHPAANISVLVESERQAAQWRHTSIGMFLDLNPGMNRTGLAPELNDDLLKLICACGPQLRGIHYYDGHVLTPEPEARRAEAHAGYRRLMELIGALNTGGFEIHELVTSGTPAFPAAAAFEDFRSASFIHRISPGTVVFSDSTSLAQLPDCGFRPAALVLSRVVSSPVQNRFTCDAGHKAVAADAGLPTCQIVGREDLVGLKPSEEHLPFETPVGSAPPEIGEMLYLLPRHICPTVNLYDQAAIVRDGHLETWAPISARGHETGTC